MEYREYLPPPSLRPWAKVGWTLGAAPGADAAPWLEQVATPDGCLEVIRREHGRSRWNGEQPACFVAGMLDRPARFEYTPDARFCGLRFWPWTWSVLHGTPGAVHANGWVGLEQAGPDAMGWLRCLGVDGVDWDPLEARLAAVPGSEAVARIAVAVLTQDSVAAVAAAGGLSLRGLQRWFARHVGVAPRSYLRVLRFQHSFVALQASSAALTEQAHAAGYADQAHMGRAFRELAGDSAGRLRRRARGPFA